MGLSLERLKKILIVGTCDVIIRQSNYFFMNEFFLHMLESAVPKQVLEMLVGTYNSNVVLLSNHKNAG